MGGLQDANYTQVHWGLPLAGGTLPGNSVWWGCLVCEGALPPPACQAHSESGQQDACDLEVPGSAAKLLGLPLMAVSPPSSIIQELLSSEQAFVGKLQFLQNHHMQYLDHCPHVPTAVASQKAVIFRNVQDISHFHSRWACSMGLKAIPRSVCTCMYTHTCLDTHLDTLFTCVDTCVHIHAQDTCLHTHGHTPHMCIHTWMLTLVHVCTDRAVPQESGQESRRDRTFDDSIHPLVHHTPVHTCPQEHRHMHLAYPRKCL